MTNIKLDPLFIKNVCLKGYPLVAYMLAGRELKQGNKNIKSSQYCLLRVKVTCLVFARDITRCRFGYRLMKGLTLAEKP